MGQRPNVPGAGRMSKKRIIIHKECNKIQRESLILQNETEKTCYKQFPLF